MTVPDTRSHCAATPAGHLFCFGMGYTGRRLAGD